MKTFLLLPIICFLGLSGCFTSISDGISAGISRKDNIIFQELSIINLQKTGFTAQVNLSEKREEEVKAKLYYCSVFLHTSCDPKEGAFVEMILTGDQLSASVPLTGLVFTSGVKVVYELVPDKEGHKSSGSLTGEVIVPNKIASYQVDQLGYSKFGFGGAGSGDEGYNAIVTDSDGNIYVAGYTTSAMTELMASFEPVHNFTDEIPSDVYLVKYTSGGNLVWQRQLSMFSAKNLEQFRSSDSFQEMVLGPDGYLYLAGSTSGYCAEENAGETDVIIAKYSLNGDLVWIRQLGNTTIGSAANKTETVTGMAVDSSGHILVAGTTDAHLFEQNAGGVFSAGGDVFIVKFNSDGDMLQSKQFGQTSLNPATYEESGVDLAVFSDGAIYIAGVTTSNLEPYGGSEFNGDIFVLKLDSDFDIQWQRRFTSSDPLINDSSDYERDPKLLEKAGGIPVVFFETFSDFKEPAAGKDIAFVTLDKTIGSITSVKQFGDTSDTVDKSRSEQIFDAYMATDGSMFIAGYECATGKFCLDGSPMLMKVNSAGAMEWRRYGNDQAIPSTKSGAFHRLIRESSGNFALIYSPGLNPLSSSGVTTAGRDSHIVRMNLSGSFVDSFTVDLSEVESGGSSNDLGYDILGNSAGETFVLAGTESSLYEANGALSGGISASGDIVLIKIGTDGKILWEKQYGSLSLPGSSAGNEEFTQMAFDSGGDIIVAGTTTGDFAESNAGLEDFALAKIDKDSGNLIWRRQIGSITGGDASNQEYFAGVAVSPLNGEIIIAGSTSGDLAGTNAGSSDVVFARYSSAGDYISAHQLRGSFASDWDLAEDVVVDGTGSIYICGVTRSDLGESHAGFGDVFLVKFNSSGTLQWRKQIGSATATANSLDATNKDTCTSLVINSNGEIIMGIETESDLKEANLDPGAFGNSDIAVAKWSSSGNLLWLKHLGGTTLGAAAEGNDIVTDITVDTADVIFVSGRSSGDIAGTNAGLYDAYVAKISDAGSFLGVQSLNAVNMGSSARGNDSINAIWAAPSGELRFCGSTDGNLGDLRSGQKDIIWGQMNSMGVFRKIAND